MKNLLRRWLSVPGAVDLTGDVEALAAAVECLCDILAIDGSRIDGHGAVLADLELRLATLEAYF